MGGPPLMLDTFMLEVKKALKPGGLLGIIDHDAKKGSDISTAQSLHRIDPELILSKMKAWGFSYQGHSEHLRNPDDPMDIPMWDPSVKGKTNKSVFKFSK